jgi:CheY-like chemotaxis protein/CRP-like cAMP-binding protein
MKTVLVVDDSEEVLDNINELLELAGYRTLLAVNGKEALELARKERPDLILCDIMMPVLDGYGVLRGIANIPELSEVPFVFLTAKAEKQDFRTGMDLGADDYLTKPFTGDDLLRVVSARLSGRRSSIHALDLGSLPEFNSGGSGIASVFQQASSRSGKKYRKNEIVFMEGETPGYVYYLTAGKIKIFKSNEFGKDYILDILQPGHVFGYQAIFEGGEHKVSSAAIEDVEVSLIPKHDFLQLLTSDRQLSLQFLRYVSNNLGEAEDKLLRLAYDSARKRVAEALLYVFRKYNSGQVAEDGFRLNRDNLSALAGISPESVSRNLSDFREEGLIEADNGYIRLLEVEKLEKLKN